MIDLVSSVDRRVKKFTFPEGQAVGVFPALRSSHQPIFHLPGMAGEDWLTSNEASPLVILQNTA